MSLTETFPWDDKRLIASESAHRLRVGERTALFCTRQQQIFELNASADAIWQALSSDSPRRVAHGLVDEGADLTQALAHVRQAARAWMVSGHLVPAEVMNLIQGPHTGEVAVRLDELSVRIRTFGDLDAEQLTAAFGHLSDDASGGFDTLSLAGSDGLIFAIHSREALGAWDERNFVPGVKAFLTERYTRLVRDAFLTHAALLTRDGKGVLLCGEPGAGKTTLTLALAGAGFGYQGDDIARIDAGGRASGAPFAPAIKAGAWPLLESRLPALRKLPTYVRSDGQFVRYLPMRGIRREAVPIHAVVTLDRQPAATAHVTPMEPLETLTTILGSAFSPKGSIDAPSLAALSKSLNGARCGRLTYGELDGAVAAIEALFE